MIKREWSPREPSIYELLKGQGLTPQATPEILLIRLLID